MSDVFQFPVLFTKTDASKPSSNVISGSLLYCADSNTLYVGNSTSTWGPPISSGSVNSGQVGQFHLSSGAVNSGHIANAAVVSGTYSSGSIAAAHISSGTLITQSGIILTQNDAYLLIGMGVTTTWIASGTVTSGTVGNGAVAAGDIASGQIGLYALTSGALTGAGGSSFVTGSFTGQPASSGFVFFNVNNVIMGSFGVKLNAGGNYVLTGGAANGVVSSGGHSFSLLNSGQTFSTDVTGIDWTNLGFNPAIYGPLTYFKLMNKAMSGNVTVKWSFCTE